MVIYAEYLKVTSGKKQIKMRSKTAKRILEQTPQEVKDRALKWAEEILKEKTIEDVFQYIAIRQNYEEYKPLHTNTRFLEIDELFERPLIDEALKYLKEKDSLYYTLKRLERMKETKEQLTQDYRTVYNQMDRQQGLQDNSAEKRNEVNLKDSLNKYNSQLQEAKQQKLDKIIDQEKIKELEIRIDTLKRLL